MSVEPIITFKAGLCDLDTSTGKVRPQPTPGYLYLHSQEDLMHLCWRSRGASLDNPEVDLIMFPGDGNFVQYDKSRVSGRIFVLKFSSSSQRHLFWLQSKSQAPNGDPSYFSPRDLRIGEIVNDLLQGEEVDVEEAVAEMRAGNPPNNDEDAEMEDVEGQGPGRTGHGGDVRREGEGSREGGADGGRADSGSMDARTIIQNFIKSMPSSGGARSQPQPKPFTTLQDLLTTSTTIPWVDTASESTIDSVMQYLPPNLAALVRGDDDETTPQPLSIAQKKDLIKRVLRSPQFSQSLASLTFALRDGGLPSIGEALNVPVANGGYMRRGGVPLGGGEAVEAFLNGVKDLISGDAEGNNNADAEDDDDDMQTN